MSTTNRDGGGDGYNGSYAATHSSRQVEREGRSAGVLELPNGRYVVEPVEEAPVLTPEQEAGIEAVLESYRQGRVVYAKRARQISTQLSGVERRPHRRGVRRHRPPRSTASAISMNY